MSVISKRFSAFIWTMIIMIVCYPTILIFVCYLFIFLFTNNSQPQQLLMSLRCIIEHSAIVFTQYSNVIVCFQLCECAKKLFKSNVFNKYKWINLNELNELTKVIFFANRNWYVNRWYRICNHILFYYIILRFYYWLKNKFEYLLYLSLG